MAFTITYEATDDETFATALLIATALLSALDRPCRVRAEVNEPTRKDPVIIEGYLLGVSKNRVRISPSPDGGIEHRFSPGSLLALDILDQEESA